MIVQRLWGPKDEIRYGQRDNRAILFSVHFVVANRPKPEYQSLGGENKEKRYEDGLTNEKWVNKK